MLPLVHRLLDLRGGLRVRSAVLRSISCFGLFRAMTPPSVESGCKRFATTSAAARALLPPGEAVQTGGTMNAIDLLKRDHRTVASLF